MSHRFNPGRWVRLCRGHSYRNAAEGTGIEGILNGDSDYQVKDSLEHHDCATNERELEAD